MKLEGKSTPDIENNTQKDVSRNNLCQPREMDFVSHSLKLELQHSQEGLTGGPLHNEMMTPVQPWQDFMDKTSGQIMKRPTTLAEDLGCGFGARPSFCQECMWPQLEVRPWNLMRLVVPWQILRHPLLGENPPSLKKKVRSSRWFGWITKISRLLQYKVIGRFHGKCWIVHSLWSSHGGISTDTPRLPVVMMN